MTKAKKRKAREPREFILSIPVFRVCEKKDEIYWDLQEVRVREVTKRGKAK